jgi:hypothetical protein
MSRSGVYYAVKAMERAAAGTAAADVPARRAVAREATAARPEGGISYRAWRVLAAMRHGIGGAPAKAGRGRRRLGGAARAD